MLRTICNRKNCYFVYTDSIRNVGLYISCLLGEKLEVFYRVYGVSWGSFRCIHKKPHGPVLYDSVSEKHFVLRN